MSMSSRAARLEALWSALSATEQAAVEQFLDLVPATSRIVSLTRAAWAYVHLYLKDQEEAS